MMSTSVSTVKQVVNILVGELGTKHALELATRLQHETCGNASYMATIRMVCEALRKLK